MRCPECGAEMNRHAEKPLKTGLHGDLNEVVLAVHYCPACGKVEAETVIEPLSLPR